MFFQSRIFWLCGLLTAAAVLGAGTPVPAITDVKTDFGMEAPPDVSNKLMTGHSILENRRFLVVRVRFTPGVLDSDKPKGPARGAGELTYLDDLELEMSILIAGEKRNSPPNALLTGKTRFWGVKLDGREHVAYMFVAPHYLDRYAPVRSSGEKSRTLKNGDFAVEAVFRLSGNVLARGYCGVDKKHLVNGRVPQGFFAPAGVRAIEDAVWPKDRSPWQWQDFEKFDLTLPVR